MSDRLAEIQLAHAVLEGVTVPAAGQANAKGLAQAVLNYEARLAACEDDLEHQSNRRVFWRDEHAKALIRLAKAEEARVALERLVADLETNSEHGAPDYAHDALAGIAETPTHGRHCPCTACAREDWTNPDLGPCGMHGPSCPNVYAPAGIAETPE